MADANGAVTGFDADVGNMLCTKLAMECVFVVQAFDGLIPALQAKQFDIIISGMSITADRKKKSTSRLVMLNWPTRLSSPRIPTLLALPRSRRLAALDGHSVGVQAGTTHTHFMEKLAPTATLKSYATLDEMQIDLANGRVDAGFADVSALQSFLDKPEGAGFQFVDVNIISTTLTRLWAKAWASAFVRTTQT